MNRPETRPDAFAHRALIEVWSLKVSCAARRYRDASEQYRRMLEELQHLPEAEAAYAVTRARRLKAFLLDDYLRKLRAFTELQQSGEIPTQEDAEDPSY